jgi:sugar-specific transcriptional regulator TrmB
MMQKDLAEELEIFGFTLNQAKVYLSIVAAGSISVSKIAESSKLHPQDIYKILPKLEEKGMITKTLGNPFVVATIPVETALKSLLSKETKNALERINRMKAELNKISNALSLIYGTEAGAVHQEPRYSLLTKESEIKNTEDVLFEEAKEECNIVASLDLMTMIGPNLFHRFQTAANNGAKIRLLIEATRREKWIKASVEQAKPDTNEFTAKFIISKSPKSFQIIDRKEVWISVSKISPSGIPCVFWTNDENIVVAYLERFEKMWNNPNATFNLPSEKSRGTNQQSAGRA